MDLGSTVVADEEPLEGVEPGEGALDDPADAAEPGAMFGLAAGDHGLDSARFDEPAVFVVVVAENSFHIELLSRRKQTRQQPRASSARCVSARRS